ncbi:MAG: DUF2283 domain-containing protein [Candidatus Aenigmatarchaeota archaeon]
MKAAFMYDEEANSLVIYRQQKKTSLTIDLGEVIIDLDDKMSIVAIEILNPNKILNTSKEVLQNLISADIQINSRMSTTWLYLTLKPKGEEERQISIPLPLEKSITV